jgi:hypothetical protein
MAITLNRTQRRIVFGLLALLTLGLGVLGAIWMTVTLLAGSTVVAFGQHLPQWILPAFIVYLATRNLVRLWGLRENLLFGEGEFDLKPLTKLLDPNTPAPSRLQRNRAQRRQERRKP